MKIRFILPAAILMVSAAVATAENARARLLYKDASHDDVLITEYRSGTVTYKSNDQDLSPKRVGASKIEAIYFYKPKSFTEAMSLYRGRNYTGAKKKFAEVEVAFKKIDTAPNNYGTLAGYYKLECSRKLMDLDALSDELTKFKNKGLTRETHLQQLEVNAFWEAVRLKDWERLDRLAQAWRKRKVSGGQRAQIAYCHGLALENLAKKAPLRITEALNAYNRVLSADFTASAEIVIAAIDHILNIYHTDPEVALAIKLWKTQDENPNNRGYQWLLEANTMVKLYKRAGLDKVKALAPDYEKFFKYEIKKDKVNTPVAKEPEEVKEPEPKKAEESEDAEEAEAKGGKEEE